MKKLGEFFTSKINIAALILVLISLQEYISNYNFSDMSTKSWITFSIGVLIVVFRTFAMSDKFLKKDNSTTNAS